MRIKVGDQWFECKPGQPIMVELTDGDKRNIANMHPDATRYALFDSSDDLTVEQKLVWMDEGRESEAEEEQRRLEDEAEEHRRLENEEMERYFREHPHG